MARTRPGIVPREQWGARGGRGDYDPRKTTVVIHHTVSASPKNYDTHAKREAHMREIENQHLAQGWDGIGYCFVLFLGAGDLGPEIYEGRGWDRLPAAQANANTGTVPISVVGNFENDRIGHPGVKRLARFARRCRRRYGIRRIRGHRDYMATACPGKNLYAKIPKIRKRTGMTG
jgi:hypothetical protein